MIQSMFSSLFSLVTQRPELLLDHAGAYFDLAQSELKNARNRWLLRVVAMACSVVLSIALLTTLGVSVTLGVTGLTHWSIELFVVPVVFSLLTGGALAYAFGSFKTTGPGELSTQLRDDLALLRTYSQDRT